MNNDKLAEKIVNAILKNYLKDYYEWDKIKLSEFYLLHWLPIVKGILDKAK